ncbi:MAG: DNA gyrase inhibitor YacG [Bryobacteraceae bacterium]|nr:DNA gyrase inhibitor YacG [Bryobacteraceae bacterium]
MKTVRCPICRKSVGFTDPEMPFCSERCRMTDLGNWASEKYVIATPVDPSEIESTELNDDEHGA